MHDYELVYLAWCKAPPPKKSTKGRCKHCGVMLTTKGYVCNSCKMLNEEQKRLGIKS